MLLGEYDEFSRRKQSSDDKSHPDPLRAPVRKQIAWHATRLRKGERLLEVLMDWPRYDMDGLKRRRLGRLTRC
ncbi:hypothetical protein GCM10009000_029580 [Halobacterium noricense]